MLSFALLAHAILFSPPVFGTTSFLEVILEHKNPKAASLQRLEASDFDCRSAKDFIDALVIPPTDREILDSLREYDLVLPFSRQTLRFQAKGWSFRLAEVKNPDAEIFEKFNGVINLRPHGLGFLGRKPAVQLEDLHTKNDSSGNPFPGVRVAGGEFLAVLVKCVSERTRSEDEQPVALQVTEDSNLSAYYGWKEGRGFYERYDFTPDPDMDEFKLQKVGGVRCGPQSEISLVTFLQSLLCGEEEYSSSGFRVSRFYEKVTGWKKLSDGRDNDSHGCTDNRVAFTDDHESVSKTRAFLKDTISRLVGGAVGDGLPSDDVFVSWCRLSSDVGQCRAMVEKKTVMVMGGEAAHHLVSVLEIFGKYFCGGEGAVENCIFDLMTFYPLKSSIPALGKVVTPKCEFSWHSGQRTHHVEI